MMNDLHPRHRSLARIAPAEALIGLGLLLLAGLVLWQTLSIPVSPMYDQVGPTVFPYIMTAGLTVFAVLLLAPAARGGWQQPDEKEVAVDWKAVVFVTAGLIANVALIGPLGFSAVSTIMFALVAYGFGSRRPLRDAAIGLVLALAAYVGFAKALGVNIGAGVIENLLGD
ncbi:tripartite tricarboxylate transporter TctB family protein (plasmid) [Microvirga sp. RSM25]|uniref:tripartite tricarboxylate transporter TctB family protein n=1 Tax=Microvirga sp. RSM25 TaxID=3273802 RepID=UPI00384ADC15